MAALDYFTVSLNQDKDMIQSAWLRAVDSEEYRVGIKHFFKRIRTSRVANCLLDFTRGSTPNINDQKWTAEFFGKGMHNTAVSKFAIVLPDDLFLEVVLEKIREGVIRLSDESLQIAFFNELDGAYTWLGAHMDTEGLFRSDLMLD